MNSCKTIVGTTYVPVHRLGGVSGEMSSAVRFSHLLHREEERDEGREEMGRSFMEEGGMVENSYFQPFDVLLESNHLGAYVSLIVY